MQEIARKEGIYIVEEKFNDMEHSIQLLNGNILECFPKAEQPEVIQPDDAALDTTGEYLSLKKEPKRKPSKYVEAPWKTLFFREAFFLYENCEKIFADSRMFLAPLPFENNLAYIGINGLRDAVLGVYLEWWESCERSLIKKDGQIDALTYFFAGSPLSGSNSCNAVRRTGETIPVKFDNPFSAIWTSFMKINQRYTEAKQRYQAYSLEETVAALKGV